MNEKEVKDLINKFTSFEINEKKSFIEALANLGGFDIDIKDLVIYTKVNYRKNKDGEYKAKIDVPDEWLKSLGITRHDNDITIKLSEDNIVISKYQHEEYEYNEDIDELVYEEYEDIDEISSEEKIVILLKENPKRVTAKSLIENGKKKGYLTLPEIMEAFSETELDKEQIKNLHEILGNLGINVIENTEDIEEDNFEEEMIYDEIDYEDEIDYDNTEDYDL